MRGGGRGRAAAAAAAEELRDFVVVLLLLLLLNSGRASFSSPLLLQRHQTREKARFKIKSVSLKPYLPLPAFLKSIVLPTWVCQNITLASKKSRLTLPLSSWWVTHVLCFFFRRWFWWSPGCDRSLCSFIRKKHSLIFF